MSDFPFDAPERRDSVGEKIEGILSDMRVWLRLHPLWIPFIQKLIRLFARG